MEPDMVLLWERLSRNSKLVSTPLTCPHSAEKPVSKDKPQVSGDAKEPERRWLVVLICLPLPPLLLPRPPFRDSEDWEMKLDLKTERNETWIEQSQHMCYTEQTGINHPLWVIYINSRLHSGHLLVSIALPTLLKVCFWRHIWAAFFKPVHIIFNQHIPVNQSSP